VRRWVQALRCCIRHYTYPASIDMIRTCTCCNGLYAVPVDAEETVAYCDRCEVAYLEFKLALLTAVYREVTRRADEV
jgi:hypothetical protein